MSEKASRMDRLIGSLWTHMDQGQAALKEQLGDIDQVQTSPALFTMFATTADGLLKLGEQEAESMWYSFAEVADQLLKQGQVTREQCAQMSARMDETSELITRACERELVEAEQRNPMAAILKGTAEALHLDHELVINTLGPILADFLAQEDQAAREQ